MDLGSSDLQSNALTTKLPLLHIMVQYMHSVYCRNISKNHECGTSAETLWFLLLPENKPEQNEATLLPTLTGDAFQKLLENIFMQKKLLYHINTYTPPKQFMLVMMWL